MHIDDLDLLLSNIYEHTNHLSVDLRNFGNTKNNTGPFLVEMAGNTGTTEDGLIIAIGSDEGPVDHFHVFWSKKDLKIWKNGACIMLRENAYFDHKDNHRIIQRRSEFNHLIRYLESKHRDLDITIWRYLVVLWNDNTGNHELYRLPTDIKMPEYDFDTILTFEQWESRKRKEMQ